MNDLQCVVVTPERTELDVKADSVTVPLFDGEMGILPMHAPLMTLLGKGTLRVESVAGGTQRFDVDGGFLQVAEDQVRVVTEKATPA